MREGAMVGPDRPIIWSPEARADLFQIWSYYIEAAGDLVADKLVRAIHAKCGILENYPFAGRPRDNLRPGIRSLLAPPHVIFYRITNIGLEIVRVIDGRQDIDEIFADDVN